MSMQQPGEDSLEHDEVHALGVGVWPAVFPRVVSI
jgi:hypothetical protein